MKLKSMLAGLAIALGLAVGPAHSQILQNLENAITGNKPSQADIAAARQEVQDAAQSALSALYAIQPSARRDIERAQHRRARIKLGTDIGFAGAVIGVADFAFLPEQIATGGDIRWVGA